MTIKHHTTAVTKKKLSLRRRHLGLTALDQQKISDTLSDLTKYCRALKTLQNDDSGQCSKNSFEVINRLIISKSETYLQLVKPPDGLNSPLQPIISKERKIDSFSAEDIPAYFRFRNKEQLHNVFACFEFPEFFYTNQRHKFSGEEVFLVGLFRLTHNCTMDNAAYTDIFGFAYHRVSKAVSIFLEFMLNNWGYLLTNNMNYWLSSMGKCSEHIRHKLETCENILLPPVSVSNGGGFNIFGFIDNTIITTCRPSTNARKNTSSDHITIDKQHSNNTSNISNLEMRQYLQSASSTSSSKSVYGIKFQSLILPNGMRCHVYGPELSSTTDLWMIRNSGINDLIGDIQQNKDVKLSIYGDSDYTIAGYDYIKARYDITNNLEEVNIDDNDDDKEDNEDPLRDRKILENHAMSSLYHQIKWDEDLSKKYWPYIDNSNKITLKKDAAANMAMVTFIFRNAHICLNGSQGSCFFNMSSPTLQSWTSQGKNKVREPSFEDSILHNEERWVINDADVAMFN